MAQEPIWPGSGSAVSGNTPFGFYDTDSEFQTEAPKFADWCAKRLGYPLMNVELQDKQFYACLEESVSEYSACLLYTSPSPRDQRGSRMPSSA